MGIDPFHPGSPGRPRHRGVPGAARQRCAISCHRQRRPDSFLPRPRIGTPRVLSSQAQCQQRIECGRRSGWFTKAGAIPSALGRHHRPVIVLGWSRRRYRSGRVFFPPLTFLGWQHRLWRGSAYAASASTLKLGRSCCADGPGIFARAFFVWNSRWIWGRLRQSVTLRPACDSRTHFRAPFPLVPRCLAGLRLPG